MILDTSQRIRKTTPRDLRPAALVAECKRADLILGAAYRLAEKDDRVKPSERHALALMVALGKTKVTPRQLDKHSGLEAGTAQDLCNFAAEILKNSPAFHHAFHSIRAHLKK